MGLVDRTSLVDCLQPLLLSGLGAPARLDWEALLTPELPTRLDLAVLLGPVVPTRLDLAALVGLGWAVRLALEVRSDLAALSAWTRPKLQCKLLPLTMSATFQGPLRAQADRSNRVQRTSSLSIPLEPMEPGRLIRAMVHKIQTSGTLEGGRDAPKRKSHVAVAQHPRRRTFATLFRRP